MSDAGVAAGASAVAVGVVTGMTVAMALAVTSAVPSGFAWVGSAAAAPPVDAGFASGFVSSDFEASDFVEADFVLERRLASVLASASVSLCALTAPSRLSESLRAALSDAALSDAVALSRDRLSDGACVSSARRGAGVCAAEVSCGRLSALLAAVLLSTSAEKLSFADDWLESDRADRAGAP